MEECYKILTRLKYEQVFFVWFFPLSALVKIRRKRDGTKFKTDSTVFQYFFSAGHNSFIIQDFTFKALWSSTAWIKTHRLLFDLAEFLETRFKFALHWEGNLTCVSRICPPSTLAF